MPRYANDISELSPQALRCRDEGHAWYDPRKKTTKQKRVGNHVERRSVCSCCTMKKTQLFTPGGKVVTAPSYDPPDFYYIRTPKGQKAQRITRADIRKITMRAVTAAVRRAS